MYAPEKGEKMAIEIYIFLLNDIKILTEIVEIGNLLRIDSSLHIPDDRIIRVLLVTPSIQ